MSFPVNNNDWRDFFERWRDSPVIWQMNHEQYKNKFYREKAWRELLDIYRRIDPNATMESLKKKVINIRTVFNREFKKVLDSEMTAACPEDVYVPTLWYFNHLEFLKNQRFEAEVKDRSLRSSNLECKEEETSLQSMDSLVLSPEPVSKRCRLTGGSTIEDYPEQSMGSNNLEVVQTAAPMYRRSPQYSTNIPLAGEKDEATIYADTWCYQYRKMPQDQQLFAKRLIDDVLIFGQLGKLNFESSVKLIE